MFHLWQLLKIEKNIFISKLGSQPLNKADVHVLLIIVKLLIGLEERFVFVV